MLKIPLFDAAREFAELSSEIMPAVEKALADGRYILGPEVASFEEELGDYLGVTHAFGVASGTDALWLALKALGVGPGDAVATTAFTFFATASAIVNSGATPVLVDIDEATFNIDPTALRAALAGGSSIKALVVVHLFGQPAEMDELLDIAREYSVPIVEDTAQAFGAVYSGRKVGGIGDIGCYSFFPTKNLGAAGDGGAVVTSNDELAAKLKVIRAHGSTKKYVHDVIGTNSRLDTVQAALLRVKLPHVDGWNAKRVENARYISDGIDDLELFSGPLTATDRSHVFHQYVVRVAGGRRDDVKEILGERGIDSAIHYPIPLHLQPALSGLGHGTGSFPVSEAMSSEVLSLPIFPGLRRDELDHMVATLRDANSARG